MLAALGTEYQEFEPMRIRDFLLLCHWNRSSRLQVFFHNRWNVRFWFHVVHSLHCISVSTDSTK